PVCGLTLHSSSRHPYDNRHRARQDPRNLSEQAHIAQFTPALRSHKCLMTYIAVTVLAMICAIEVNSWTKLVRAVVSRTGTTTSDPGPGWGSLRTNSQCRRVRTSPLA